MEHHQGSATGPADSASRWGRVNGNQRPESTIRPCGPVRCGTVDFLTSAGGRLLTARRPFHAESVGLIDLLLATANVADLAGDCQFPAIALQHRDRAGDGLVVR